MSKKAQRLWAMFQAFDGGIYDCSAKISDEDTTLYAIVQEQPYGKVGLHLYGCHLKDASRLFQELLQDFRVWVRLEPELRERALFREQALELPGLRHLFRGLPSERQALTWEQAHQAYGAGVQVWGLRLTPDEAREQGRKEMREELKRAKRAHRREAARQDARQASTPEHRDEGFGGTD